MHKRLKDLSELHIKQDILCLVTEGHWLPAKVSKPGPELHSYMIIFPSGATHLRSRQQLKACEHMALHCNVIPG